MIFISYSIENLYSPAITVPPLSHLTSCNTNISNLYLANSLAAAVIELELYRLLTFHVPNKTSLFLLGDTYPRKTPHRRSECWSSLPPDCFVSRGSITPWEYFLTVFLKRSGC